MKKIPEFDFIELCLNGFKKKFSVLCEADPREVAEWLYETVSAFSGRDGRCLTGGGSNDVVCALAAAADIQLEVCSAREIKNGLRDRLRRAWLINDHMTIFSIARGFERNASMAVVDLRDVAWADPYRVIEDDDEEGIEIPEAVEEWVEVLCEPGETVTVVGNHSRSREARKPAERAVKSLFEGV